jgi:hypothetical protein
LLQREQEQQQVAQVVAQVAREQEQQQVAQVVAQVAREQQQEQPMLLYYLDLVHQIAN